MKTWKKNEDNIYSKNTISEAKLMVKSPSTQESRHKAMKSSKGCEAYSVHPRVLNTVTLEIKEGKH